MGFRRTAVRAASGLGISGYVINERDGSVSVEAQGTEVAIARMIELLREGRYIRIDNIESTELAIVENEKGFSVKYV